MIELLGENIKEVKFVATDSDSNEYDIIDEAVLREEYWNCTLIVPEKISFTLGYQCTNDTAWLYIYFIYLRSFAIFYYLVWRVCNVAWSMYTD